MTEYQLQAMSRTGETGELPLRNAAPGSSGGERWSAVVQLAHQLDDAAQHITERQAYDFATRLRILAGLDGAEAAADEIAKIGGAA